MAAPFTTTASRTANLIAMVRASLEAVRKMLATGSDNAETKAQVRQLELLEQLLLDQDARLDSINRVLEEFNYSVAHELCAPLRRISGFTREIKQRCADEMDLEGINCLNRILESSQHMNELIDALMEISRLAQVELQRGTLDLSLMVREIAEELRQQAPDRQVVVEIQPGMCATGDATLVQIALRKLMSNAWKFTADKAPALIEFGAIERANGPAFFVRDNGVGFDMSDCGGLFHPFQRLHDPEKYPGNGIGLTTVKRIVERHGGQVWAEGAWDKGAAFFFSLPE